MSDLASAVLGGGNKLSSLLMAAAKVHRLLTVHWEITYRCNTRCTHCYAVKPGDPGFSAPSAELSTQECFKIVDAIAAEGALQIVFSGGEILTRTDFLEVAAYARTRGFLLRLLTNGTLITPNMADMIQKLEPMSVEISMYGSSASTHDKITLVRGSFDKVLQAFRLLRERGVRTTMKVPVVAENVGEVTAMKAMAQELHVGFQWDSLIVIKTSGDRLPLQHRAGDQELLAFFREELDPTMSAKESGPDDKHCFSGMHTVAIDPYGEVFPCIQHRHSAGNLRTQGLGEILRGSPVLQEVRAITVGSFSVCRSCPLRGICSRCPGATETETGDLLGPSQEACRQAYLRYKVLQERGSAPPGETPLPAAWEGVPTPFVQKAHGKAVGVRLA